MRPCFRVYLLIAAGAAAVHLPDRAVFLLLVGYFVFESLDRWLDKRTSNKKFEEALADEVGWSPDPDDPENEIKGNLGRRKLSGSDLIIVTRLTEFLWRTR